MNLVSGGSASFRRIHYGYSSSVQVEGTGFLNSIMKFILQIRPRKSLLLCFVFFFISIENFAQPIPRVRITGKVTDAGTRAPLHFVNVYLAGTTKGAATDETGRFTIPNVPLGSHELIISMIGYELSVMKIRLIAERDEHFRIKLRPKPVDAPELEVTAPHPRLWKKHLKNFTRLFIGTSDFASKCKILNPEVLDFNYDSASRLLTASAAAPLEIESKAMGYRIQTYLMDFSHQEDGVLRYIHKPKFIPLTPKDKKEEEKWHENRLEAYHGSIRHFIAALVSHRLEQEGFYADAVSSLSHINNELYLTKCTNKDLIRAGEKVYERHLAFHDFVKVYFSGEGEYTHEGGYEVSMDRIRVGRRRDTRQISVIKMNLPSVIVNTAGHISDPYAITTYGYWASERIAEELPLDYHPGENSTQ